jgi:hypothetical protein
MVFRGPHSEATKQKQSIIKINFYKNPEERKKQSDRSSTPEARNKKSDSVKKAFADPDVKRRHKESLNRDETRKKLSNAARERCKDPEYVSQILYSLYTPEAREHYNIKMKERWEDPEFRQKHIDSMRKPETRKNMKLGCEKRSKNPEYLQKLFQSLSRERNANWNGGISFEPYCEKFNFEFKERVREFFGRICVECQMTEEENGQRLTVHHANYDKMVCCNDVEPLFVALCIGCNSRANNDREYWTKHYTDIINNKYDGKCYYTKEEMSNIKKERYKNDA